MSLAIAMLSGRTAALAIPGLTRVRTRQGTLTSSTARAPSKEGLRPTAVILDESHLWVQANGGHRLAETLRRQSRVDCGWTDTATGLKSWTA